MKKSPSSLIKFAAILTITLGASACVTDTCNLSFAGITGKFGAPTSGTGNITGDFNTGDKAGASCGTIGAILKGT